MNLPSPVQGIAARALSAVGLTSLAIAASFAVWPVTAGAQSKGEIRIAHVYSKTGPLEAYAQADRDRLHAWVWNTPPAAR